MKNSILVLALLLSCVLSYAQNTEVFSTKAGAINGYDAVSYFTDGKPVKGDAKFTLKWEEATWLFSSKKNLELFKASPSAYAPQYGGYCAFATSKGAKAPTMPDAWTIVNNKLYLNYNTDVQKDWSKDKEALIKKAEENWPTVKKLAFK
jgi:YHS domain-containing protein